MNAWMYLAAIVVGLFLSAVFSGSEIGLYRVLKPRVELEAGKGLRGGGLLHRSVRKRSALLITILIGNNVALELMTLSAEAWLKQGGASGLRRDLVLSLVLTPTVFVVGSSCRRTSSAAGRTR
ncbi:MAG: DUF21 domain-containing protein [Planctomycetes bacterium]|nr:DUF21 domain-containing protein [Planctomycetota bacterium]